MVYLYQENIYKEKYNMFLNNIIYVVKKNYPNVSNKELSDILNGKSDYNYLNEYGIDVDDEFALISMHNENKKIFIINNVILGSFILVLSIILIINKKKKKIKFLLFIPNLLHLFFSSF